ncbi:uncharacterized protein LOC110852779 [Folsomia candida]|uniref:uncharacterized protein LOC110852779 n=1 Tax=Folsomia candida TaxID=158441 RepID=UPI001604BAA1|nr:uncharacterized protein LOC110852779 [Folsomia candida]
MKCVRCSGLRGGYMDKMFDVENMVEMSYRIFRNEIYRDYLNLWKRFLNYMELSFFNLNSMERSNQVGKNTTTWSTSNPVLVLSWRGNFRSGKSSYLKAVEFLEDTVLSGEPLNRKVMAFSRSENKYSVIFK